MIVLLILVVLQFLGSLGHGSENENPFEGSLETYVRSVKTKRVALIMPLHGDNLKVLHKRFKAWNGKRFPCVNRREHHMMDIIFYMSAEAQVNSALLESEFTQTEARQCFGNIKVVTIPNRPQESPESEENYAFFRVFEQVEIKANYDVFMYMSPQVWQVAAGWADHIYEEAVLADAFWVRGSAAMATCPKSALTAEGDCDGSIGLGFPAVMHIHRNALYSLHSPEFASLRERAERKYPGVGGDVAMFKELVSTDHPITNKLMRGAHRRPLSVGVHHNQNDQGLSHARAKSGHVTSLYWPAHVHRYQYSDFIVNALAGKKHFKQDLLAGHHPNTVLVHQGFSE